MMVSPSRVDLNRSPYRCEGQSDISFEWISKLDGWWSIDEEATLTNLVTAGLAEWSGDVNDLFGNIISRNADEKYITGTPIQKYHLIKLKIQRQVRAILVRGSVSISLYLIPDIRLSFFAILQIVCVNP